MGHEEGSKGSQKNVSFDLLHSEISPHKEGLCLLDSIGEGNNISVEAYKEGKVLASEILKEEVDISCENSHGNPFQRSFEYQSDSLSEEWRFGPLSHGKQRT